MDIAGNCFNLFVLIATVVNEIHNLCENVRENKDKYVRIKEWRNFKMKHFSS